MASSSRLITLGFIDQYGFTLDCLGKTRVANRAWCQQIDLVSEEGFQGFGEIEISVGIAGFASPGKGGNQIDIAGDGVEIASSRGTEEFEAHHTEFPAKFGNFMGMIVDKGLHFNKWIYPRKMGCQG